MGGLGLISLRVSRVRSRLGLVVGGIRELGPDICVLAWEFHEITTNDIMDLLIVPPEKVIAATIIAVSVENCSKSVVRPRRDSGDHIKPLNPLKPPLPFGLSDEASSGADLSFLLFNLIFWAPPVEIERVSKLEPPRKPPFQTYAACAHNLPLP